MGSPEILISFGSQHPLSFKQLLRRLKSPWALRIPALLLTSKASLQVLSAAISQALQPQLVL